MPETALIIRSWPKTVLLYPVALAALACGGLSAAGAVQAKTLGFVFCTILFFNLVVLTFEFRKHAPVVLFLVALVLALGGVLLNQRLGLVDALAAVYGRLEMHASPQFYFATAAGYLALLVMIFVHSRFEYWEVRANEVLHHTGLLGDCERFPAPQLRVRKEIVDVFEYLLLRSGRIVITASGREAPIVLENVPGINGLETRLADLLDSLQVKVEKPVDSQRSTVDG